MKNKEIENRLKSEVGGFKPADVYKKVVRASKIQEVGGAIADGFADESPSPKRGFGYKLAAAVSMCAILIATVAGVAIRAVGRRGGGSTVPVSSAAYVTVQINPQASFVTDSDGKVESVRADNADAEAVLKNVGVNLVGLKIGAAAEEFVDSATELGYVDFSATAENPDVVKVTSIVSDGADKAKVADSAEESVKAYFKRKGLFAVVLRADYSKDELVGIVKQFDKTASLNDDVSKLNSLLAKRKDYTAELFEQFESEADGNDAVSAMYYYYVIEDYFNDMFSDTELKRQTVLELYEANKKIEDASVIFNGFYYKNNGFANNEKVAELMPDFISAYEKYAKEFHINNTINNTIAEKAKFDIIYSIYNSITNEEVIIYRQKIDELLNTLKTGAEQLDQVIVTLKVGLSAISDILTDLFDKLDEEKVPQNATDLLTYISNEIEQVKQNRISKYNESYNADRKVLTDSDYENIVKSIKNRYGSLQEYYEFLQKK